jgi:hypothetical protein
MASDETVRFIMGHSVDMSNISATTREELNKYEILLLNVNSFHGKQNDRGWMRFWILIINGFILIPTVVLVSLSYGIQAIGDICGVAILFFIIISLSYAVYTYSEDQNIIRKNITQQKQVYEIGIKIKEMIEQDLNRVYNQKISSTKKTIIVDLNRLFEQIQKN